MKENIFSFNSGDLVTEASGGENLVDGKATWELSADYKDDIEVMRKCCEAELAAMDKSGFCAAPYCFERLAILARKKKDYELEVWACETYIDAMEAYYEKMKGVLMADVRKGARYRKILQRLPKAREFLSKNAST